MLKWLSGSRTIRESVRALIAESDRLDIAVAFWGGDALTQLELTRRAKNQVRVIANLASGGTNPSALREIWENVGRFHVKQLGDLHAKVFLSDRALIVGSANVSANGLGLESGELEGWREACLLTDTPSIMDDARQWFEEQWRESTLIEERDFALAEAAWRRRRRMRPVSRGSARIERGGLLAFPRDRLQGRHIHIAITSTDMSDKASRARDRIKKIDSSKDGYEGWKEMPLDATLLAFNIDVIKSGADFKVEWDGFWDTPTSRSDYKASTIDGLTLVRTPPPEHVLPVAENERAYWEKDIRTLCRLFRDKPQLLPPDHSYDDWCLLIEDAWTILNNAVQEAPSFGSRGKAAESTKTPEANRFDSPLDTIGDADLRAAIRRVARDGKTFQTTEVIREINDGVYLIDRGLRGNASANVRFARRMSTDRDMLGIRLVRRDESVTDDRDGTSMTSRWALTD